MKIKIITVLGLLIFFSTIAQAQYFSAFRITDEEFCERHIKLKDLYEKDREILKQNKVKKIIVSGLGAGTSFVYDVNTEGCIVEGIETNDNEKTTETYEMKYNSSNQLTEIKKYFNGKVISISKVEYTDGLISAFLEIFSDTIKTNFMFESRKIKGELRLTGYAGRNPKNDYIQKRFLYSDENFKLSEIIEKKMTSIDVYSQSREFQNMQFTFKNGRIYEQIFDRLSGPEPVTYYYTSGGLIDYYMMTNKTGDDTIVKYSYEYY